MQNKNKTIRSPREDLYIVPHLSSNKSTLEVCPRAGISGLAGWQNAGRPCTLGVYLLGRIANFEGVEGLCLRSWIGGGGLSLWEDHVHAN